MDKRQLLQQHKANQRLAIGLLLFAGAVAASVFGWRLAHHKPAMPSGSGYGMAYVHENTPPSTSQAETPDAR